MACGCNKKANVNNTNNTGSGNKQENKTSGKLPLITTNSSSDAKKTALGNVAKKISKRQQ